MYASTTDFEFCLSWTTATNPAGGNASRVDLAAFDATTGPLSRAWGFYNRQGRLPTEDQLDKLLARARRMREGVEARLALAVDVFFPLSVLFEALTQFHAKFPSIPVHLRTEGLGAVAQLVADEDVQFGISQALDEFPPGIERAPLGVIELITVCGAAHPLARDLDPAHPLGLDQMREHTQLVLTDRSTLTAGRDNAVAGENNWRLADLPTKQASMLAGFGWGNMPVHMVTDDLAQGRLVRLQVDEWGPEPFRVPIAFIHRTAAPPGPAGRWLIQLLRNLYLAPNSS